MQWQIAIFSMVPVLVFTSLRPFGERLAYGGAVATAAAELAYNSVRLGFLEPFSLASFVLFAALALASVRWADVRFFQLQPVVLQCGMAVAFLLHDALRDGPALFVVIVEEFMGLVKWLAPWRRGYVHEYLLTLATSFPFLLLVHAGATTYATFRLSVGGWLLVRVPGFYAMFALLFLAERFFGVAY